MVGLPSDVGVSGGVDLADFGCGDVAALLRPLDGQLQVGGVAADGVAPGVERAADGGGVDLPEPQAARRVDADQVVVVQAGGQPRQTGPRRAAVPLRFHHSAPSALTSKTRSFFFCYFGGYFGKNVGWGVEAPRHGNVAQPAALQVGHLEESGGVRRAVVAAVVGRCRGRRDAPHHLRPCKRTRSRKRKG